ncbi:MAG TPA: PKD domain-containing protein [Thermoplasmatales archaeon]|nr:PKD domain-containing protein [Thermoplasmatales archaeon]
MVLMMHGCRKRSLAFALALISVAVAMAPSAAVASTDPLPIYGKVVFQGRGIAGVTVEIVNQRTGDTLSEVTDDNGVYVITFGGPTHPWDIGDQFLIRLSGSCLSGQRTITVTASEPQPVEDIVAQRSFSAAFDFSPANPVAGENISFADASTGSITSHAWDFGDGNSSTAANPVHAYQQPGNYTVTLTVSCQSFSSSATATVQVAHAGSNDTHDGDEDEDDRGLPAFAGLSCLVALGLALVMFKRRH